VTQLGDALRQLTSLGVQGSGGVLLEGFANQRHNRLKRMLLKDATFQSSVVFSCERLSSRDPGSAPDGGIPRTEPRFSKPNLNLCCRGLTATDRHTRPSKRLMAGERKTPGEPTPTSAMAAPLPEEAADLYREILLVMNEHGVPYAVAGAFALEKY